MDMPPLDQAVMAQQQNIARDLRAIVGREAVLEHVDERRAYEQDGLTAYKALPLLVVLPANTAEVAEVLRYCHSHAIKVVPRGAGTSLSGGALPLEDGILLGLGRFQSILEIDEDNRCARVQPGVTNLAISQAVAHRGLYYAPDPSSQIACSIGGNVAENAGGVHCLKYGLTTHNISGLEIVMLDGTIMRLGGAFLDQNGYDLIGVITGSEGLLCVVTEVTVRLLPAPEAAQAMLLAFDTIESAGEAVAAIIAQGIIPAGMEMMDRLAIEAAEDFCHAGYPRDCAALLIVELDGTRGEIDELVARVRAIAQSANVRETRVSSSDAERALFWAGRKAAFPAVGRISPDYLCMDGTIPRHQLSCVLGRIQELSDAYGLRVANVFHAGDGNLHPLILFDANAPGELEQAEALGADILKLCVEVGGVLSGEHGIGVEKRDLMPTMFNEADLKQQQRLKCAFDPHGLLNPGKVFPTLHRCAELGRMHVHGGRLPRPDLPHF